MAARWAEALLKLQRVDLKIRELEARLALLPKEMTELKNKRDAAVAEVNAAASAAKKIELERKGVESEIEKLNAENKRLQQQSAMVKKNTEYQAMLGTIALNEKKVGDLESRELELMDRFEEARKAYRKIRQDNEAAVNAIRAEFDELVAFAGDLKKEIAQLKEERPADIRGVDAPGDYAADESGSVDSEEPSVLTLLALISGPVLRHKGQWPVWLGGVLLCVITALTVLFADELFRWHLSFRIRNADRAEPSDWEIAGRYLSWTALPLLALVVFILGLR